MSSHAQKRSQRRREYDPTKLCSLFGDQTARPNIKQHESAFLDWHKQIKMFNIAPTIKPEMDGQQSLI